MAEKDYHSVVESMRLTNGTVWSIPITLAVEPIIAETLTVGEQVALVGEADGVIYGLLDVQSIYEADQHNEALKVFKTNDMAHPGVQKLLSRPSTYVGGPIQVLNRPQPSKFQEFYFDPSETRKIFC